MVLVNDKEIPVYKLDTNESLKSRIASSLNTLPKYIYGLPEDITKVKKAKVKDILSLIKKEGNKSIDFNIFLEKNKDFIGNLDLQKDVLHVWLAYNNQIETLSEYNSIILDQVGNSLIENGYFSSIKDFTNFWKNTRPTVKQNLDIAINQENLLNKKYTELYETFENIPEGLGYTDLKTERVMLSMILDLKDITLLEIFNYIVLNENIPFALCKNYCKILKDYIPTDEWNISGEDNIVLKMHEKVVVDPTKYKDYTDVKIDLSEDTVSVAMRLITERGYLSRDQFIERFLSVFSIPISYKNIDETEVIGIFYFPQERINTYVFSDLVMNNIVFSGLINIDESSKATKKKTDSSQPWLYIHFNHPSTGHVTAGITQKVVNRAEQLMRDEDPEIFPHGQPYIRVRVKGGDKKSIEFFQEMFSKLLVVYNEKYDEIVEIYDQFIPNFGVVEEIEVPELKQSDLAPDVFVSNFSRYCSEARYPTIVSEKQAKKYKKEGKEIMVFPRDLPETGQTFESDGKNQNKYVCLNPEYPYPGLQINTKLSNSKEFPYLPCCFKNEQSSKIGGIYRNYYFGEELESKDKKQQDLITTDKILAFEKYGMIAEDLQKLFEVLDTDTNYKYIRVGVDRNHSSFLNAVMVGLHEQTGILELSDVEEREVRLLQIRSELASEMNAVMARQSCYDMTVKQISENLNNPDVYMDPKLYTQLLEEYFDCNIFLFNREKMFLPRFAQSYYKRRKMSTCIFIYEHWGSESDSAKYPQCELIIRWNTKKKDDTEFFFSYESKISRNINKVFRLLNESYALDKKIPEIVFDLPDDLRVISQHIDTYGKTRCVNVVYKKKNISLLTDPIPPLQILENVDEKLHKVDRETALKLIELLGTTASSQILENPANPALVQINFVLGNVKASIPVSGGDVIENVETIYDVNSSDVVSSLQIFNQNKKMARYITEYMLWLFSSYIQRENIAQVTDKVLAKFAKTSFVVDGGHQYNFVEKNFSLNNDIVKDGKIIVKNEDMLKRLMYILKLFSIRDMKSLRSYYLKTSISQYYVDITDFDYYPSQVILQGEDSIDKWIQESKFSLELHRDIPNIKTPYFFKNDLVDEDKVFLAQNTNTLEKALAIAVNWHRNGYNIGLDAENMEKRYAFTLYSYVNPEDIKVREIRGKSFLKKIRIVGYKLGGTPFYTTLLELE